MMPLLLILLSLALCQSSPIIQDFEVSPDTRNTPIVYFLHLIPTSIPPNATLLYLKAEGRDMYAKDYPLQFWPDKPIQNGIVTYSYNNTGSWFFYRERNYTIWASFDTVHWSDPYPVVCCKNQRPSNQTTLVLSGIVNSSVFTPTQKIKVSKDAILDPVFLHSLWEIEIENGASFVISPSFSWASFDSPFPIDIEDKSFTLQFDQDFKGTLHFRNPKNVKVTFAAIYSDKFPQRPPKFTTSGPAIPLCTFLEAKVESEDALDGRRQISFNAYYDCPESSVSPITNMFYAPLAFLLIFIIVFATAHYYFKPKLVTMIYIIGITGAACLICMGLFEELAVSQNLKQCKLDGFCPYERDFTWNLVFLVPPVFGTMLLVWVTSWLSWSCCRSWKGEERPCSGWTARGRASGYIAYWAIFFIALFGIVWVPIAVDEWHTSGELAQLGMLMVGLVGGGVCAFLVLVSVVAAACVATNVCGCACCLRCFGEGESEYDFESGKGAAYSPINPNYD